jgi:RimJ/RimL family protein N-acetyltransferase
LAIKGEKVRLRPLESGDLQILAQWRNENSEFFFSTWPIAQSEQAGWYQKYLQSGRERQFMIEAEMTVSTKADNLQQGTSKLTWITIGTLALLNISHHNQSAELGRVLIGDKRYAGKGYMEAAIEVLIHFAFNEANMNRVYVEFFAGNEAAQNLYKSCGFWREGRLWQSVWKNGAFRNTEIWAILRNMPTWEEVEKSRIEMTDLFRVGKLPSEQGVVND